MDKNLDYLENKAQNVTVSKKKMYLCQQGGLRREVQLCWQGEVTFCYTNLTKLSKLQVTYLLGTAALSPTADTIL